jgi:arylsulfatase A-like enzyme|uniref:sulfatase n=1 Tax=Cephaloticoccus sp. TaxID=1985742 RepID=UPI00404B8261
MQPNILFILIDDLGWRDLTCYGSSFYETPNLDLLATGGMRFTDAYASCPVCSPTRASLMTGKYPARVGVTNFIGGHSVGKLLDVPYMHHLPMNERSIATALRDGGYQTWHIGKWHLGNGLTYPKKHGFDVNIGGCGWGMPNNGYFSPWGIETMPDGPEGQYLTDAIGDAAVKQIRERDRSRPFFLNLWHYAVHTPIQAPESLVVKYRQKAARLGLRDEDALEEGEFFPSQHIRHLRVQRRRFQSHATYAAMIESLDTSIGRVLDTLESEGIADDTLVVFTSDNGGLATAEGSPTCNAPLSEGKGWMYEGGNRVCQIARWPGRIAAGSECATPTTSPDWYPTLLEAAGLPLDPEQHVDGISLLPLLKGDAMERGPIFWHYPHYPNQGGAPAASVRDGDWKLIEFFEDGHLELYNLREDIGEDRDLTTSDPVRLEVMADQLHTWQREIEAIIPRPNPHYIPPDPANGVDPAEV